MAVWKVLPVTEEPEVVLVRWQVIEVDDKSRHFIGYSLHGREGRVSSAIQAFDPVTRRGRTRSGRVYALQGASGQNQDALYVWSVWADINGVRSARDVTQDVMKP